MSKGVKKFLKKLLTNPSFKWFSRDLFWDELSAFGLENIGDASEEIVLDCLAAVNESLRAQTSMRERRKLEPNKGPQCFADCEGSLVDYCGERPQIFRYFNAAIFWEEVRKLDADARPHNISERVFVEALQATSNRMANWSICRTSGFPTFEGPQVFPHRADEVRMSVGKMLTSLSQPPKTDLFGWLQCSQCEKWRRVSGDALEIWGERFHASHKARCRELLEGDAVLESVVVRAVEFEGLKEELLQWMARRRE